MVVNYTEIQQNFRKNINKYINDSIMIRKKDQNILSFKRMYEISYIPLRKSVFLMQLINRFQLGI